ncbi:MAG: hypothetical protein ACR2RV_03060 [Verrucomicrobiales bacterium]
MKKLLASAILSIAFVSAADAASVTAAGQLENLTPPGFGTGFDIADLDDAGVGTDGFVIFNTLPEGSNESNAPWDNNIVDSKPAYISAIDGTGSTSSGGWANYDDVTIGGTTYNTGGVVRAGVGDFVEAPAFTITIGSGVPATFRIGLITDNTDSANWSCNNTRIEGPGAISANQDVIVDGAVELVQFDIADAVEGEVYTIHGTSTPSGLVIGGVTFDTEEIPDLSDPTDVDGNGIGDNWEEYYYGDTGIVVPGDDDEPDGLTNTEEWMALSNPLVADSDGDGLEDGPEVKTHMTNPNSSDTEDDGFSDSYEVDNLASGFDPLVDDSDEDPDMDGLNNAGELANNTDPIVADSDADDVNDGDEVNGNINPYTGGVAGALPGDPTDPNDPDSDADGLSDFEESDNSNGYVTDPNSGDTDGDTVPDQDEIVIHNTDPTDAADFPPIPDGLISVDLQGDPAGANFESIPVLMSGYEAIFAIPTGTWNALDLPGHENTAIDPGLDLVDSNGAATGVRFSIFGTVSSWTNAPGPNPITNDYLFVNAGNADVSARWELSGLSPQSEYSLYTYGGVARDMLLTVDTNGDGNLAGETPANVDGNGFEFSAIAGTNGKIIGAIEPGDSGEANWGGFQLLLTTPALDTDGDGLSDELEEDFGTDPLNPDTDGDGQGDGAEVNSAGTDPTNPLSVFKVLGIRRVTGNAIELRWSSVPGKSYAVDASTDLGTWTEISSEIDAAPSPEKSTAQAVETPGANEPRKQYRLRVE